MLNSLPLRASMVFTRLSSTFSALYCSLSGRELSFLARKGKAVLKPLDQRVGRRQWEACAANRVENNSLESTTNGSVWGPGQLALGFFLLTSCALPARKRGCAGVNTQLCSGTQVSLSLIMLRHPSGVVLGIHEASNMMLWQ